MDPLHLRSAGTSLVVSFDIYNNGGYLGYAGAEAQPAPSIDVRFGGTVVATAQLPLSFMESGARLDDAIVQLNNECRVGSCLLPGGHLDGRRRSRGGSR